MNRLTTRLPLPNNYDDYIQRLADQLEKAKLISIDSRAAVMIAAVNLLSEFLEKIGDGTEEEGRLRLQALAGLVEIRKLPR